jgi:hypothetical protein
MAPRSRRPKRRTGRRTRTRAPASDPKAMTTVRSSRRADPPQTSSNILGFKRLRQKLSVPVAGASLTLGSIRNCLPVTAPEIRILHLSVWAPNSKPISVVFPISNAISPPAIGSPDPGTPGDNSTWTDVGVLGNSVSQIHLRPAFDYRNFWFTSANRDPTLIATFGGTLAVDELLTIDISVQYRTAPSACAALLYLNSLRFEIPPGTPSSHSSFSDDDSWPPSPGPHPDDFFLP